MAEVSLKQKNWQVPAILASIFCSSWLFAVAVAEAASSAGSCHSVFSSRETVSQVRVAKDSNQVLSFETSRTRVRPPRPEDEATLEAISRNQANVQMSGDAGGWSGMYKTLVRETAPPLGSPWKTLHLTVEDKQTGQPIGLVKVSRIIAEPTLVPLWKKVSGAGNDFAEIRNTVTIGYTLAQSEWGKGIATEVLNSTIQQLFTRSSVDQIIALTIPTNKASQKVLEKTGFKLVGKDHQYDYFSLKSPRLESSERKSSPAPESTQERKIVFAESIEVPDVPGLRARIVSPQKEASVLNKVAFDLSQANPSQPLRIALVDSAEAKNLKFAGRLMRSERLLVLVDPKPSVVVHELKHWDFWQKRVKGANTIFEGDVHTLEGRINSFEEYFTYPLTIKVDRGTERWLTAKLFQNFILRYGFQASKDRLMLANPADPRSFAETKYEVRTDAGHQVPVLVLDPQVDNQSIHVMLVNNENQKQIRLVLFKPGATSVSIDLTPRDPEIFFARLKQELMKTPSFRGPAWTKLYQAAIHRFEVLHSLRMSLIDFNDRMIQEMETGVSDGDALASQMINLARQYNSAKDLILD